MRRWDHGAVVVCLSLLVACSKGSTPTPSPGTGSGESITGRERIGWDQPAANSAELANIRYAVYVDGARSELTEVTCATTAGAAGFGCSARLPPMSPGSHVLELASFIEAGGILESGKSAPFRVTVTGVAPGAAASLTDGEVITTVDGVRLRAEILWEGLTDPTALAVTRDGRAFIGTTSGLIVVKDGAAIGSPQLTDGPVLALTLSPSFERDPQVFVTQAARSAAGSVVFRTSRFRDLAGRLGERMVILENGPASRDAAAAVRFGPDGKLYLAFDDGGSADASERMSEWYGKVLRMEPDGRTPEDQAAASPVLFRGLTSPRGLDWTLDGSSFWIADASRDGVERLRVIASTSERPRRAGQRGTFVMPAGLGAAALSFYRAETIREFAGDLLIAGREGGYILRVRFENGDRAQPTSTERLLEERVGPVRALTIGADGAIYFCTKTALVRLVGVRS